MAAGPSHWRMTACEISQPAGSLELHLSEALSVVLHCGENVSTPFRVMPSVQGHRYDASLYAPSLGKMDQVPLPKSFPADETELLAALDGVALFNLHWPELMFETNRRAHERLIEILGERQIEIVWTQHNLLPHAPHRSWKPIYQLWANVSHGVIHHSNWGMNRARDFRRYRPDAVHRVIRHGHWGAMRINDDELDREELARPYKMAPDRIHMGVLGAPRTSKDIGLAVDGFLASSRDDLDLTIFSLAENDSVPKHPRILGRPYKSVSRQAYNRRLAFIDVLLFPIRPDGAMLTTGLIGDAIVVAKPAIVSEWPFLTETFGEAAMVYGSTAIDLSKCLDELDVSTLDDRSDAMRTLQEEYAWERSAEQTLRLFRELIDSR